MHEGIALEKVEPSEGKHLSPAEREKSLVIADHKKLFYSN